MLRSHKNSKQPKSASRHEKSAILASSHLQFRKEQETEMQAENELNKGIPGE